MLLLLHSKMLRIHRSQVGIDASSSAIMAQQDLFDAIFERSVANFMAVTPSRYVNGPPQPVAGANALHKQDGMSQMGDGACLHTLATAS
jgi:hypothetical protein